MTEEDISLEHVAKQIAEAVTAPYTPPDAQDIERVRQDMIDRLRADPSVTSAWPDPSDPLGVVVAHKTREPIQYIAINIVGSEPTAPR